MLSVQPQITLAADALEMLSSSMAATMSSPVESAPTWCARIGQRVGALNVEVAWLLVSMERDVIVA
jgi:hypothetical protein